MDESRTTIVLDLDLTDEPIGGELLDDQGEKVVFHGWLQLVEQIESIRRVARE